MAENPELVEGIVFLDGVPTVQVSASNITAVARKRGSIPMTAVQFGQRHLANKVPGIEASLLPFPGFTAISVAGLDDVVEVTVDPQHEQNDPRFAAVIDTLTSDPAVRVVREGRAPEAAVSSIGGWSQNGCTSGVNAVRGGVTVQIWAGHCVGFPLGLRFSNGTGSIGVGISNQLKQDGFDIGLLDYDSRVSTPAQVDNRRGGRLNVGGYVTAYPGMAVCKYGRITGETCGYVTKTVANSYVLYSNLPVYGTKRWYTRGLVKTSACTRKGDSGGPWIRSGTRVVGLTTGGKSAKTCGYNSGYSSAYSSSSGDYSLMSSMAVALQRYGATLKTS